MAMKGESKGGGQRSCAKSYATLDFLIITLLLILVKFQKGGVGKDKDNSKKGIMLD